MKRKTWKLVVFLGMLLAFVMTTRTGTIAMAAVEGGTNVDGEETPASEEPSPAPEEETPDYEEVLSQIQMKTKANMAVGTQYQLILNNVNVEPDSYSLQWNSSNPAVATVTEQGTVKAISVGTAYITCMVSIEDGTSYYNAEFTCKITVTNPRFSQSVYYIGTGKKTTFPIVGSSTTSCKYISSNNKILRPSADGKSVTGLKKGQAYITAMVDGRYISCRVIISNVKINYSDLFLVTGKKATIKVTGQSGTTKVKFTSGNKKIATVTSKGVVKAVKTGSTTISIAVDGRVYTCYVAVGKNSVITSLNRAYKALGSRYSQPLRMRKGYYDCSSLVWRTYSPSGYKFGHNTYAPTAAAQAKWLVTKKKAVANKGIAASQLRPGDLLYMNGSSPNGRYRNISHVAIYIGNGRILHAKGTSYGVCIDKYSTYQKRVVVIGRF